MNALNDLAKEFEKDLRQACIGHTPLPEPVHEYVANVLSAQAINSSTGIAGVTETARHPLDVSGRFLSALETMHHKPYEGAEQLRLLGDKMLFTIGFAPEFVLSRCTRRGAPPMEQFMRVGAMCYGYASSVRNAPRALTYLSLHFNHARQAISWLIRDEYNHKWRKVSYELVLMAECTIPVQ